MKYMNIKADGEVKQLLIGKQDANGNVWCGIGAGSDITTSTDGLFLGSGARPAAKSGVVLNSSIALSRNIAYYLFPSNITQHNVWQVMYECIRGSDFFIGAVGNISPSSDRYATEINSVYVNESLVQFKDANNDVKFVCNKNNTSAIGKTISVMFCNIHRSTSLPAAWQCAISAGSYSRLDFYNKVSAFISVGSSRQLVNSVNIQCDGRIWVNVTRLGVLSGSGGFISITAASASGGWNWGDGFDGVHKNNSYNVNPDYTVNVIDDVMFI